MTHVSIRNQKSQGLSHFHFCDDSLRCPIRVDIQYAVERRVLPKLKHFLFCIFGIRSEDIALFYVVSN